MFEEALALDRGQGSRRGEAQHLIWFGLFLVGQGEDDAAQSMFQEALVITRQLRETRDTAVALYGLGMVALHSGDSTAAQTLFEEALALHRGLGTRGYEATNLLGLGSVAMQRADYPTARARLAQALEILQEIGERNGVAASLELFGQLARLQGQAGRAARLFGAAEGLREAMGVLLPPAERAEHDRSVAAARTALGEPAFAAAWAAGQAMSLDQAITVISNDTGPQAAAAPDPPVC
jgi:tetratricopeptide (TPR) repeat protein